jgi:hypothetical protein
VDVGGFAEPRKILCQCALPSIEQLSVYPDPRMGETEFPNTLLTPTLTKRKYNTYTH